MVCVKARRISHAVHQRIIGNNGNDPPTQNELDDEMQNRVNRDKRILFAAIVYTISEGFSATLSKLRYRSCAHVVPLLGQVFQREVFQTAVTYFMRAVTAAVGTYKDAGLHVDIFAWMVLAVLVEFAVEIFVRTAGAWHFGTAEVFTYFNIKLAIFIFEIALDQDWVTMLYGERHQGNPWATFTFFLWMAANFGLVVYYNVPSNQRWDDSVGEQAWEAGWWVIAGTQMTITTGLCAKACHRRWDLGFGEPF